MMLVVLWLLLDHMISLCMVIGDAGYDNTIFLVELFHIYLKLFQLFNYFYFLMLGHGTIDHMVLFYLKLKTLQQLFLQHYFNLMV